MTFYIAERNKETGKIELWMQEKEVLNMYNESEALEMYEMVVKSQIEHGGEVKPCLAVVIEPYPKTKHELELIGEEIRACMLGLQTEDVE